MAGFDTPLVKVLGGSSAAKLQRAFGHRTVGDLLRHYPRRYADRFELTPLDELRVGEDVTVLAEIKSARLERMRNRPGFRLVVVVTDGAGVLSLVFFFKKDWQAARYRVGQRGLFSGRVSVFKGERQLTHPDFEALDALTDEESAADYAAAPIAIYPATKDVRSLQLAKAIKTVLSVLDTPPDPLPDELRQRYGLIDLDTALRDVHRPRSRAEAELAVTRLKWDEALVLQVALARRRAVARATPVKPRVAKPDGLLDAFDRGLPFELTVGQRRVGKVIAADLAEPHPMHRLLQGEVGSGKTVVALRAMLTVIDSGAQAALLAPTEVLAAQHYRSITDLLGPLSTGVVLITGSLPAAARRRAVGQAATGEAGIVVGTHALLEGDVRFADLGLVVVDEQHRFGVEQRDALRAKGADPPHLLVMTATPIPRTVAMTVYGDLETSTLRELPPGRSPVSTHVVCADQPAWVTRMWGRVRDEVAAGHQAYVVCPRIGEAADEEASGDEPDDGEPRRPAAAVSEVAPRLAAHELAGLRLGTLHGRLPAEEKDHVMRAFSRGELDVLVATTVVEVGVDVPGATVMVVLDADRFGVSQLHQLRGRVGRGSDPAWCLLHTETAEGSPARARLDAVASTSDGFRLARVDLEQRREGDVLGVAQSGRRSGVRLLRLLQDEELIAAAREQATALVDTDPELAAHPAMRLAIEELLEPEQAAYLEKA